MSIVTYNNRSIRNVTSISGAAQSLTHIKTLTASSSATLSFVDGSSDVVFDSTYPIYLFKFYNIHPASDAENFQFNASADTGSNYNVTKTTTAFYAFHQASNGTTSLTYSTGSDLAQGTGFFKIMTTLGNDNEGSGCGELYLFAPSSTTFVKHFMSDCNNWHSNNSNSTVNWRAAGYCNTTTAIDGVQFKMDSGNIDAGTIKLYGIKDS